MFGSPTFAFGSLFGSSLAETVTEFVFVASIGAATPLLLNEEWDAAAAATGSWSADAAATGSWSEESAATGNWTKSCS